MLGSGYTVVMIIIPVETQKTGLEVGFYNLSGTKRDLKIISQRSKGKHRSRQDKVGENEWREECVTLRTHNVTRKF